MAPYLRKQITGKNHTETPHIPGTAASIKTLVFENTNKKEENQTYRRGSDFVQPEKSQIVCKWHMRGICRFGKWCRNLHPKPNHSSHHPVTNGRYRERQYGPLPHYANAYTIPKPHIPSLFANSHPFPYPLGTNTDTADTIRH